jgi:hypothetical protein
LNLFASKVLKKPIFLFRTQKGTLTLENCSLIVIEFVEKTPLGKVEITLPEIYQEFNIIKN